MRVTTSGSASGGSMLKQTDNKHSKAARIEYIIPTAGDGDEG